MTPARPDAREGIAHQGFEWPAPVKLNLFLHVNGRRADGFHDLQTFFRLLDFGDSLFIQVRHDGVLQRLGDTVPGVTPENDLILRAADCLRRHVGRDDLGADITLHKRAPVGGGLGGGSSDAATTLRALDRVWGLDLPQATLEALGLSLGSDVPVFVRGLSGWAEGRGERLRPDDRPAGHYLVVRPDVSVRTAELFGAADLVRDTPRMALDPLPERLPTDNAFLPVLLKRSPAIRAVYDSLRSLGLHPRLTGTGACLFVPFPTRAAAVEAAAALPPGLAHFTGTGRYRSALLDALDAHADAHAGSTPS
ncbi:MAG: 4-(cytidine 5'-diphospho)-2-C-methyl-D-erythritol kinase [Halothiobacillaceae bacterium]